MAQYFLVSNQADEQAALNAGIPADQIRYVGATSANASMGNGYQAPTDLQALPVGETGVYVGQAAQYAPAGAQTIAGANRAQTQTALQQYATSVTTTGTHANMSASGTIDSMLSQLGLTGLSQWALNLYAESGSWDYVASQLPTTPTFQARFPAWQTWASQGHTAAQYVDYENTLYQAAQAAGFPQGTVNQDTITAWINNGVSASEGTQRIQAAQIATSQLDTNSEHYLRWKELGLTDGDLAAVFFDPKTSLPVLQQKVAAAQIGGAAAGAGIDLATGLATNLVNQGVTQATARQGFAQLANDQQLLHALPGQVGPSMDQSQAVGAEFGTDATAAQTLAKTRAGRLAPFQSGGGFTGSNTGLVGVGKARGA